MLSKSSIILAQYTLKEAVKNKILSISLVMTVIGVAVATFIGDYALVETERTEVTFLASFYRYCAIFSTVLLVVSTMVREFSDKCLELYMSLPISRVSYFVGKLLGFLFAGVVIAAIYSAALMLFADVPLVLIWGASLVAELFVMATLSFFCVLTFNQQATAAVMCATLFYFLCRAIDDIILIGQSDILLHTTGIGFLRAVIDVLAFILPNLGQFTQTSWLLYSDFVASESVPIILAETVVYVVLISTAALVDFTRKNI